MWPNLQETVDFVTFTEEILHGKFPFLCSKNREFAIEIKSVPSKASLNVFERLMRL